MNDNKTLKDIINEVTEQEIEENCPELKMSPEEMMAKIKANEKARKKKRLGYIAVAAVLIVAFVVMGVKFGDSILHVDADKNGKEEILTDEGVIIEDKGWERSDAEGFVINDWNEIELAKMHEEKIIIPKYVPNEYEFVALTMEMSNEGAICSTLFNKGEDILEIYEVISYENMVSHKIESADRTIDSTLGEIHIKNNGEIKIATICIDDGIMIEIHCNLSDTEILRIIDNMN